MADKQHVRVDYCYFLLIFQELNHITLMSGNM